MAFHPSNKNPGPAKLLQTRIRHFDSFSSNWMVVDADEITSTQKKIVALFVGNVCGISEEPLHLACPSPNGHVEDLLAKFNH